MWWTWSCSKHWSYGYLCFTLEHSVLGSDVCTSDCGCNVGKLILSLVHSESFGVQTTWNLFPHSCVDWVEKKMYYKLVLGEGMLVFFFFKNVVWLFAGFLGNTFCNSGQFSTYLLCFLKAQGIIAVEITSSVTCRFATNLTKFISSREV